MNFISKETLQRIREGIPTPAKKTVWHKRTVESILTNEKYKGAALLQKRYTVDFLQKKMKVNEGEYRRRYNDLTDRKNAPRKKCSVR